MENEHIFERKQTVCFTGHRYLPKGEELQKLIGKTDAMITAAYSRGYRIFITGGAIGFDTLAACRVIALQKRLSGIRLRLALPCRNQTERWSNTESLALYKRIMASAEQVDYMTDFYTDSCMMERNRYMVERSALCIAYCTKQIGGTVYTIKYAEECGLGVINLATNSYTASEFERFSVSITDVKGKDNEQS